MGDSKRLIIRDFGKEEEKMDVRKLLEEVKRGDTSIEEAENAFKNLPYEDLGYAKLDLHRKLRLGFPETVFCQGKPDAYLADNFSRRCTGKNWGKYSERGRRRSSGI